MEAGKEIVITRNGEPVARMSPIKAQRVLAPAQQAAWEPTRRRMEPSWELVLVRWTAPHCMNVERFTLDTNVLAYALDSRAGTHRRLADDISSRALRLDCRLTIQAVSEFCAARVRKRLVPADQAAAQAEDWRILFPLAMVSADAVRQALRASQSGRASYWDALLIAAAAGCAAILTEDLSDGSHLFGVRVINPFTGASLSPAAAALLQCG